jgi:hypothetical protein
VAHALNLAQEIGAVDVTTLRDADKKRSLQSDLEHEVSPLWAVADALVGAVFSSEGNPTALDTCLVSMGDRVSAAFDSTAGEDRLRASAQRLVDVGLPPGERERRPLHWPLAYPEVFLGDRQGFQVFVGNPPFMGNTYWKERLGRPFGPYAARLLRRKNPGKIDLGVIFLRRVWSLLAQSGTAGMITALNARNGASAIVGFGHIAENGTIYRARTGIPWPGSEAVHVNTVGFSRAEEWAERELDREAVVGISGKLTATDPNSTGGRPMSLSTAVWAFQGSDNSKGLAFLVREGDDWFERLRAASSPFLRPYFSGDDIAETGLAVVRRWCIDVLDASLEDVARACPTTHDFLLTVVAPTRTAEVLGPYRGLSQRWWQYWNHRADLYRRLRIRDRCLVMPKTTHNVLVIPAETSAVFTTEVRVIGEIPEAETLVLLSDLFDVWVRAHSNRLKTDLRVSVAALVSFPFGATASSHLPHEWWASLTELRRDYGTLTRVLGAYHDPGCSDDRIHALRGLRDAVNSAALDAIGWNDVDLELGFHETDQGVLRIVSSSARTSILRRLLEENHRRHAAEVAAGLASADGKKKGTRKRTSTSSDSLF